MNNKLIDTILLGIVLAMGVSLFVLNILKQIDTNSGFGLVSVALIALSIYLYRKM